MHGDMLGQLGTGITLLDKGIELASADLDDGQLGGDEKTVQQDQDKKNQQPQENHLAGFPLGGRG